MNKAQYSLLTGGGLFYMQLLFYATESHYSPVFFHSTLLLRVDPQVKKDPCSDGTVGFVETVLIMSSA